MARDPFDEFFRRMMRQFFRDFEEIENEFKGLREDEFSRFATKKPGRIERSGFSIFFSSDGVHPPKIEMKRFGPSGKWEKVPIEEKIILSGKRPREKVVSAPERKREKAALPEVKEKVIPNYNVSLDVDGVTITVDAKGVENKENVRLKFYQESVEIYAVAPKLDKGYFCTVAVPSSVDKNAATVKVDKERIVVKIPRKFPTVR
ncbi:MAG TPA: hypothetical protein ENF64_01355 [Hadesarchaea archaeon]|nr:hypothetical protein [Hadesarchaea archaeon]